MHTGHGSALRSGAVKEGEGVSWRQQAGALAMPVWLQKPEMGWHQGDRDEYLVLGKARAMHWDPPPHPPDRLGDGCPPTQNLSLATKGSCFLLTSLPQAMCSQTLPLCLLRSIHPPAEDPTGAQPCLPYQVQMPPETTRPPPQVSHRLPTGPEHPLLPRLDAVFSP